MNRREFACRCAHVIGGVSLFTASTAGSVAAPLPARANTNKALSPDQALQKLLDGNRRFAGSMLKNPHHSMHWRTAVAEEQHPFAVILSCSDSRVPPEIIFDEGLGDLFVIRTAGHVAGDSALGSIEYAVGHLGVGLVLVLGHENCGAVKATVDGCGDGENGAGRTCRPVGECNTARRRERQGTVE